MRRIIRGQIGHFSQSCADCGRQIAAPSNKYHGDVRCCDECFERAATQILVALNGRQSFPYRPLYTSWEVVEDGSDEGRV